MGSRGQHPGRVWKTILRGPRPPSVRWEKERSQSAAANPKKELKWKDTVAASGESLSHNDQFVKVHQRCMRQLTPRSQGCRLQPARWAMQTWLRKRVTRLRADHPDAGIY